MTSQTEWRPPPPPRPRHGIAIAALAVALVVALAGGAAGWVAWRSARDDANRLEAEAETARTTRPSAAAATTTEPSTRNPLDDLGDLGGLLGGDAAQFGECFGDDIGGLLGSGRLQLPETSARAQYDALVKWVERDRDLTFTTVPKPTYVGAAEMARRVRAEILREYSAAEAQRDQALLVALGALRPGTNLRNEYSTFVGGQVAGYYDPRSRDIVIRGSATRLLDATELTIVAHELEHALADQALRIPNAAQSATVHGPDAQLATTALVEGDATVTMTDFQLQTLDLDALRSLGGELPEQFQALQDAPHYLSARLLFPYQEGLKFVCALKSEGGWDAVDRAYKRPPRTTAQILFPDRYTGGESAEQPAAATAPGPEWRRVRTQTFGAADLMFLFEAPGNDTGKALSDPRTRAARWGGGTVTQWNNGTATSVTLSLVDRTSPAGPSLCDSMRAWLAATPPVSSSSARAVQCTGDRVQVSLANG